MRGPSLFVPRVLWAALLFTLGVYAFVVSRLPAPEAAVPAPLPPLVLWPLSFAVMLASVVVVPLWGRSQQRRALLRGDGRPPEVAALQAYFPTLVIRLALAESVAIYGLVNAVATADLGHYLPSAALAGVTMLWHFPTRRRAFGGP